MRTNKTIIMKTRNISFKIVALLALLFIGFPSLAQDVAEGAEAVETAVVSEGESLPIYKRFGMSDTELFSWLLGITLLLVVLVLVLGNTIRTVAKRYSDEINKGAKILLIGLLVASPSFASAAEADGAAYDKVIVMDSLTFWHFIIFDILLVLLAFHYIRKIHGLLPDFAKPKSIINWNKLRKEVTDTVPVEEEASILLDHDYDGIKELDNNLPPWWKYGFYVTIVWAVGYIFYYQILEIGNLQEAEYLQEMEEGDRAVAEYKAAHPELITADNVELLEDPSSLAEGKSTFETYCVSCHMENGTGGIGPNLTDKYWIYDGSIKGVFTTISEGADNGMVAWKEFIPADQIQKVASYVLSLEPALPPLGKEPQGDNIFE